MIVNGCKGLCFLDGRTYRYLFSRTIPNECEWHPIDAALMICVAGSEIYTWAPRTDLRTIVFTDSRYTKLGFGPYKGNPSRDGNRLVVRATDATGQLVAFAYDIAAKVKYPDIALAKLAGANGYCTISPSGNYVYCDQTHWDGSNTAYVFSLEGAIVQHWAENHRPGHGDMTIDADGSDVYVGISKAAPDKYHVIKRRLVDGTVTDLAPYGEAQHASTRNTQLPGWVFLTYAGNPLQGAAHPDQAPFWQEVTALRIDGSGELRRIVQTRNPQHDYWSETHASPSPDGSQVIWSSNWQSLGGPVSDYVARLTRSLNGRARESSHKLRNKL